MQWFLALTAAVAFFLILALVVGRLLPKGHTARGSTRVSGSPDEVWRVIVAPEGFPEWRPGVEEVEVLQRDADGPARWRERGTAGSITFEVIERRAGELLVLRIVGEELPFEGTWRCALGPDEGGTRVRITEEGEFHSPFFRFVARFVLGYDARLRDYLEGLEERMAPDRGGAA